MTTSVRAKLVTLLVVVAVVPLAAAMALFVVVGGRRQVESFGRQMSYAASEQAATMRVDLVEDVEWLVSAFQEPATLAALAEAGTEMTPEQRKELDDAWPTMDPNAEPMAKVLTNAVSGRLQSLMGRHPWPREILLTDRFGQLVAATGRTSDFYQADEEWWQRAYRGGQGRLYVPPVGYDKSSDVWSVDLCIPVIRQGQVLGVCKVVRDVSGWMRSLGREVGGYPVSAMLVTRDGAIVYRAGTEPLTSTAEEWYGAITGGRGRGWRTTHGGVLQGYAWVALPRSLASLELDGQAWAVVLYLPKDEALGPIYGISLLVLTVGSILIGVIFLGGLWLVNRSIVRRVRRLAQATRRVAGGDLSHRLPAPPQGWRLLGRDEIDDLTEDFNTMLAQIQSSHEGLRSANQLKADFIRVASHELRTPVSYMLGVARLLKDCQDPDRLLHAVQTMGAKASRLNQIIEAMFKLMPNQVYSSEMHYAQVSLKELLEEVYLDCFPFVERRGQRLITEISEELPPVQADRDKLRDVVENLVMNAIKFTPDGGVIKVRASLLLGGYVSISVQDQGPGIPERDLPHIFEPFYSGGDVMRHSTGTGEYQKRGMGLGLAVVRQFVELHRGSVNVTTGPNGSLFVVSIPVEAPPRSERPAEPQGLSD